MFAGKYRTHTIIAWLLLAVGTGLSLSAEAQADTKPLIFMPFAAGSEWYVVQGPHGSFSHSGDQRYGYDFIAAGTTYGQQILAPASGKIVELRDGVPDWSNNSVSIAANNYGWGNTLVIESDYEGDLIYVRIAHIKYGTTDHLWVGAQVTIGDYIGEVGQTGFSTNPHLHMQLQRSARGPSIDFDFVEGNAGSIPQGRWVTSMLRENLALIDNYGRTNVGSFLGDPATAISKRWRYWSTKATTIGTYATSDDDDARYYWRFNLPEGGRYDIYATCYAASSRVTRAQYRFYGPGISEYSYVNQRQFSYNNPSGWEEMFYVNTVHPATNNRYHTRVRKTGSGRVCADALLIWQRN